MLGSDKALEAICDAAKRRKRHEPGIGFDAMPKSPLSFGMVM